MIYKQNYVCVTSGRGFTRRTSGNRHNLNLHSGMSKIAESSLYYIGILQGKYPTPGPSTASKTIVCNYFDLHHSSHLNKLANPHSMIFFEITLLTLMK